MNNVIHVTCPSCNQQFQAPSIYEGKDILCVHCKVSVKAVKAPQAITQTPPLKQCSSSPSSSESIKEKSLWEKLNSFSFKELTRNEILICSGVVLFLVVCFIFDPPSKSKSKSKSSGSSMSNTSEPTPSHYPVVKYIKETAKDPSSIEIISRSEPEKVKDGIYRIRVKYRGKNGFGGFSVEDKIFYLQYKNDFWQVTPY